MKKFLLFISVMIISIIILNSVKGFCDETFCYDGICDELEEGCCIFCDCDSECGTDRICYNNFCISPEIKYCDTFNFANDSLNFLFDISRCGDGSNCDCFIDHEGIPKRDFCLEYADGNCDCDQECPIGYSCQQGKCIFITNNLNSGVELNPLESKLIDPKSSTNNINQGDCAVIESKTNVFSQFIPTRTTNEWNVLLNLGLLNPYYDNYDCEDCKELNCVNKECGVHFGCDCGSCDEGKFCNNGVCEENYFHNCGDLYRDPRDGQVYQTVQIGDQCWFAENLNYGVMVPKQGTDDLPDEVKNYYANNIPPFLYRPFKNDPIVTKLCCLDDESQCDDKGALYSWDQAVNWGRGQGIQGICPPGWHIPTEGDWREFENFLNNQMIQAQNLNPADYPCTQRDLGLLDVSEGFDCQNVAFQIYNKYPALGPVINFNPQRAGWTMLGEDWGTLNNPNQNAICVGGSGDGPQDVWFVSYDTSYPSTAGGINGVWNPQAGYVRRVFENWAHAPGSAGFNLGVWNYKEGVHAAAVRCVQDVHPNNVNIVQDGPFEWFESYQHSACYFDYSDGQTYTTGRNKHVFCHDNQGRVVPDEFCNSPKPNNYVPDIMDYEYKMGAWCPVTQVLESNIRGLSGLPQPVCNVFNPSTGKVVGTADLSCCEMKFSANEQEVFSNRWCSGIGPTPQYMQELGSSSSFGSGAGGGGCFIPGTKVLAEEGWVDIETVKLGDKLVSQENELNEVIHLFEIDYKGKLYSFNELDYFVTDTHPFLTTEGWKSFNPQGTKIENPSMEITLLEEGDYLITINGSVQLQDLKSKYYEGKVYNFKLSGDSTYIAEGFIVHNVEFVEGKYSGAIGGFELAGFIGTGNPGSAGWLGGGINGMGATGISRVGCDIYAWFRKGYNYGPGYSSSDRLLGFQFVCG